MFMWGIWPEKCFTTQLSRIQWRSSAGEVFLIVRGHDSCHLVCSLCRSSGARPSVGPTAGAVVDQQDVVVLSAGPWGRWQAKQAVLLALLKLPIAWFQLSILFLAPPHPFWCEDPTSQPEVGYRGIPRATETFNTVLSASAHVWVLKVPVRFF